MDEESTAGELGEQSEHGRLYAQELAKLAIPSKMLESWTRQIGRSASRSILSPAVVGALGKSVQSMFQSVLASVQPLAEQFDRTYSEVVAPFVEIMIEEEWPPPAMEAPLNLRGMQVVVAARKAGASDVGRIIERLMLMNHDRGVLEAIADSWSQRYLLKRRNPILQSALRAHLDGEYFCSVPTLLSQVEGVVVDGFGHVDWLSPQRYSRYLESLVPDAGGQDDLVSDFRRAMRVFHKNVVLANFIHGQPVQSALSRHAILHGADVDYGKEATSLKAILLVDALQDCFHYVWLAGSEIFHHCGCTAIRGAARERLFSGDRWAPAGHGKRPCRVCRAGEKGRWQ
jgi:hypothetical protein